MVSPAHISFLHVGLRACIGAVSICAARFFFQVGLERLVDSAAAAAAFWRRACCDWHCQPVKSIGSQSVQSIGEGAAVFCGPYTVVW